MRWIRLPVLPRPKPVYKTGASAAQPSRKICAPAEDIKVCPKLLPSAGVGPPGVAPGPRRLRVGRTVSPILWALKNYCRAQHLQRWELNPLSNGYEPSRAPFAFAAINAAHGSKIKTCPRVALPSLRFCRPSGHARRVSAPSGTKGKGVRCVGVAPTRRASRARMLLLHHHLGAPARTCTSTLRLRTAACTTLTPRER